MHDYYLIDIGWIFFGAWGIVVAVVTYKAFAPDLFARRTSNRSREFAHPAANLPPIDRSKP